MFASQMAATHAPIVIEVRGIEVVYVKEGKKHLLKGVPSFKTGKGAFAWKDKQSGKLMARPVTKPEHKKWMELAIRRIESTLRSTFQITDEKIRTVASPRLWIASLVPLDDSWRWCPEETIRVSPNLCAPEEEGATITITRLT